MIHSKQSRHLVSPVDKDSWKVTGKARFPETDISDRNRSVGHAAGDRNQPCLPSNIFWFPLFQIHLMPTPPLQNPSSSPISIHFSNLYCAKESYPSCLNDALHQSIRRNPAITASRLHRTKSTAAKQNRGILRHSIRRTRITMTWTSPSSGRSARSRDTRRVGKKPT